MTEEPIMQKRSMPIDIDLENLTRDSAWPTQRLDLAAALGIIAHHQARSGGGGVRLIEDWGRGDNEDIWIKLTEWGMDLTAHYCTVHGSRADAVMGRVRRTLFPLESVR